VLLLAGTGPDSRIGAAGGDAAGAAAVQALAGCTADSLPANDDGSTALVALPFSINFFGTTYNGAYVNNNGNVTFEGPLATFTPFGLVGTETVIIAPFFADVDTRGPGSGVVRYGATNFGGRTTFCVNWVNVGYYNSRDDKLNSFQLLLIDRSDVGPGDFDVIFNYDQVQWETGGASGGTDGLGGSSARAGYSNGSTTSLELPGSAVNGAFLDTSPSGLARNSRGSFVTGRYIFEVRNGVAPTGGSISGTVVSNESGFDVGLEVRRDPGQVRGGELIVRVGRHYQRHVLDLDLEPRGLPHGGDDGLELLPLAVADGRDEGQGDHLPSLVP
jgi:hypothetical protein